MKASLLLIVGLALSGCAVHTHSHGYVEPPHADVHVHHRHRQPPPPPRPHRHDHDHGRRDDRTAGHVHYWGCGHILRGGVWVSVNGGLN